MVIKKAFSLEVCAVVSKAQHARDLGNENQHAKAAFRALT